MASGSNQLDVHLLNNALSMFTQAIQVASSPTAQAASPTQATVTASDKQDTTASPVPSGSRNQPTNSSRALQILPSFMKRKNIGCKSRAKKAKSVTSWDRDIICLPKVTKNGEVVKIIPYPRRSYRAQLGAWGLIGKLHLTSDMSIEDVEAEVRSVFEGPMKSNSSFPFTYLQPTGAGNKSLNIPVTSSTYQWTSQQVAKLGNSRGSMYIMALDDLDLPQIDSDDDSDDSPESPEELCDRQTEKNEDSEDIQKGESTKETHTADSSYRNYVDIIDLTGCDATDPESDSEIDELPPPPVSIHSVQSLNPGKKFDITVIKHVLLQHQRQVITAADEEDFQRINIRRCNLFNDALRAFSKPTFNVSKVLKVRFVGDNAAVDDGGPRREFFSLLIKEIFNKSGFFYGWPSNVVPLHNVQAVAANTYYVIGKMLSVCIIQGGEPPACFAEAVAEFIVYDHVNSPVCIEDIPDFEVRKLIKKIDEAATTEELKSLLSNEEYNFRFDCGYLKPTSAITIVDKKEILRSIWLYHVFFHPHAALQQLRNGFRETLQMEVIAHVHDDVLSNLLMASQAFDPTSKQLVDEIVVKYSDSGSNNRTKEEAIMLYWNEFIINCETKVTTDVCLSDVLHFFTGARKIPATGFESTLTIAFTNIDMLPTTSTCDCSITFPRQWALLTEDQFNSKFIECVLGSFGFGKV